MKQFVQKVIEMREAQKEYFRTREYCDLHYAIRLENEVDGMIMDMRFKETGRGWL